MKTTSKLLNRPTDEPFALFRRRLQKQLLQLAIFDRHRCVERRLTHHSRYPSSHSSWLAGC